MHKEEKTKVKDRHEQQEGPNKDYKWCTERHCQMLKEGHNCMCLQRLNIDKRTFFLFVPNVALKEIPPA